MAAVGVPCPVKIALMAIDFVFREGALTNGLQVFTIYQVTAVQEGMWY